MPIRRILVTVLLLLVSVSGVTAQSDATPDSDKEKAKKEQDEKIVQMLDQAIADAGYLRVPQNKAIVFAMAADLYWKFDEKRARELFRAAAGELLAHNLEAEQEKKESTDPFAALFESGDPRTQVLPLVAKRDAEMALEMLIQTRPAALADAMMRAAAPDARSDLVGMGFSPENQRVQNEIRLEQSFALQAVNENPERAVKLIKDSLSKGISPVVLQLLQKLHSKDEKKASELAADVIRKIVETDLTRRGNELQVAMSFLQFAARRIGPAAEAGAKTFRFTDAQAKDLANKLANTFLQPSNAASATTALARALPDLEKIVPERAAMLKQRLAERQRSLPAELRNSVRMQQLFNPNSTPEEILAQIPKMQSELERTNAYQILGGRISQVPDEARAKKLIDQIPDERARAQAAEQFESARISRIAGTGKVDDARKMIGTLTNKKLQVQKLVSLALVVHKKGTEEDIETAKGIMKEARGLINESPEDEDELTSLMEVVKGYAVVEPNTAFLMFEPIVEQINDIVHASAILSKYNKRNRTFKKGELLLRASGNSFDGNMLFRYLTHMQLLGKSDLDRMSSLSDRFQRSDVRTLVKLIVVQGFLAGEKEAPATGMPAFAFFEY